MRMIQNGKGTRWFGAILLAFSMGSALQAQSPDASVQRPVEYRLLPRAVKPHSSEYAPASAAPNIVSKPIQPYAYGWFGAKTQMHWHRQFGTRRAYTQWTLK
jgi:hypothetical protein